MKANIIQTAALCAALVLTMAGAVSCDVQKDSALSPSSLSSSADGADASEQALLVKGVWAVDDGEQRTGYYLLNSESSGSYLDTEYGMGVGFEAEVDGSRVDFHMGAADVDDYVQIVADAADKRTVTWEADGRVEHWVLLTDADPANFTFYSVSDLLNAAYADCEKINGTHPEFFGTNIGIDGMVDIQLYDQVNGHNSTAACYQVDSLTGKGKNVSSGENVDFSA